MSSSPKVTFEKIDTPYYKCPECEAVLIPLGWWKSHAMAKQVPLFKRNYYCHPCHQEYLVTVSKQ